MIDVPETHRRQQPERDRLVMKGRSTDDGMVALAEAILAGAR